MCDESCARGGGGTRRSYSHSSSRLESRNRLRSNSVTTLSPARGSGYRGSRNRSRVRRGHSSMPEAGAGGDRSVHQALCGGIVVRSTKHFTDNYGTESTRHFLIFERCPNFCILFCIYEKWKRSLWKFPGWAATLDFDFLIPLLLLLMLPFVGVRNSCHVHPHFTSTRAGYSWDPHKAEWSPPK